MSEKPTFNQINDQQTSAYLNGTGNSPSVLIRRSGPEGRITVGNLQVGTRDVHFTENGEDLMHREVSLDKLTDSHQEMLAAELAGAALRGSSTEAQEQTDTNPLDTEQQITAISAEMDGIISVIPESERNAVWRYGVAVHDSETYDAIAGISPDNLGKAKRYRELMTEITALRRSS